MCRVLNCCCLMAIRTPLLRTPYTFISQLPLLPVFVLYTIDLAGISIPLSNSCINCCLFLGTGTCLWSISKAGTTNTWKANNKTRVCYLEWVICWVRVFVKHGICGLGTPFRATSHKHSYHWGWNLELEVCS